MPQILDGNRIRDQIKSELRPRVAALPPARLDSPSSWSGTIPASEIYVRNKIKACQDLGIYSESITPPDTISTEELLATVERLNARQDIDGILVQLPLPPQVDTKRILLAVSPAKDVDGFHPCNVGNLVAGLAGSAGVHAGGDYRDFEALRHSDRGEARGGSRAQRHRRQARGNAAVARARHGHDLPLQDARPGCRLPGGGYPGGGARAAGDDHPGISSNRGRR